MAKICDEESTLRDKFNVIFQQLNSDISNYRNPSELDILELKNSFKDKVIHLLSAENLNFKKDFDKKIINNAILLVAINNAAYKDILLNYNLVEILNNIDMTEKTPAIKKQELNSYNNRTVKDYVQDKILESYGSAEIVLKHMLQEFKNAMASAFLYDRDNFKFIGGELDMNESIQRYLEKLFLNIKNYLNELNPNNIDPDLTIYKDGKYNLKFTEVKSTLENYLHPTSDKELLSKYNNYINNDDSISKKFLDAYNSHFIIKNFDFLLRSLLSKSVSIKNYGNLADFGKYRLTEDLANNGVRFDQKELSPDKVIDDRLRLIIETSPKYVAGNLFKIENAYLTPEEVHNNISKIKALQFNPNAGEIIFDGSIPLDINLKTKILSDLSLRGKSLKYLVSSIRLNPQKYLKIVYDVLNDSKFYDTYSTYFLEIFNYGDRNILYSIYKNVFAEDGPSLYNVWTSGENRFEVPNYYKYFTVDADYTSKLIFNQYFKNLKGEIELRTLEDYGKDEIRKDMERHINASLGYQKNNEYLKKLYNKLNIKELQDDLHNTYYEITLSDSSNNKYSIIFRPNDQKNLFEFYKNNYSHQFTETDWKEGTLLKFISTMLNKDFTDKNVLGKIFLTLDGPNILYNTQLRDLLSFSTSILINSYITNNFSTRNYYSLKNKLNSIFKGENNKFKPDLKYSAFDINMVSKYFIPKLERISNAVAIELGRSSSNMVKTGDRKTLSTSSLTQMATDINTLFLILNSKINSITKNFPIIKDNKFFLGNSVSKEYYDTLLVKPRIKMNVAENYLASFLYDYIGGLTVEGKDVSRFVPTTNSDKPNVPNININTNAELNKGVDPTLMRNATTEQIKTLINNIFGEFYSKSIEHIDLDLKILRKFATEKYKPNKDLLGDIDFDSIKPNIIIDIYNNFLEFNNIFGNKAYDVLNDICRQYNLLHTDRPLKLTDQMHIMNTKGLLNFNRSLMVNAYRFNPEFFENKTVNQEYYNLDKYNINEFWKLRELELLEDLLRTDFAVETTDAKGLALETPQIKYLNSVLYSKGWIDRLTGSMILAKLHINGKTYNIREFKDFSYIDELGNEIEFKDINHRDYKHPSFTLADIPDCNIELNPELQKFNALNFYNTQQYVLASVGTYVSHDAKGGQYLENINLEEAARFLGQCKRNVMNSATMKLYQLNSLDGTVSEYNVAVIEDIFKGIYNLFGIIDSVKPFDGATFINPFTAQLENNSLGGSAGGNTRKPILMAYDEYIGNSVFIKTAGFPLSNELIRNSFFNRIMMRKMTEHTWKNEDGSNYDCDITWNDLTQSRTKFGKILYKDRAGHIIEVKDIKYIGNNNYDFYYKKVDGKDFARPTRLHIDNNYDLWNAFGGRRSVKLLKSGEYIYSEDSIRKVADIMNIKGIRKSDKINTLEDFYQPLKHSDIHLVATIGSVKNGAFNVNSSKFYNNNDFYNFGKIKINNYGVLLDPTHFADLSLVHIMTLVISALCSRGYTATTVDLVYLAIATLSRVGIKDLNASYNKMLQSKLGTAAEKKQAQVEFKNSVLSIIAKSLISLKNLKGIVSTLTQNLIDRYKSGKTLSEKEIRELIPWSDPSIFGFLTSSITATINRDSTKKCFSGGLLVLNPSETRYKLYGERTLAEIENISNLYEILRLADAKKLDVSDVLFDRFYTIKFKDKPAEIYEVCGPETVESEVKNIGYWELLKLRDNIESITECIMEIKPVDLENLDISYDKHFKVNTSDGKILWYSIETKEDLFRMYNAVELSKQLGKTSVEELIPLGRELAAYHAKFECTQEGSDIVEKRNIWDLDSIKLKWDLELILKRNKNNLYLRNADFNEYFAKFFSNGISELWANILREYDIIKSEGFDDWYRNCLLILLHDLNSLGNVTEDIKIRINGKDYIINKDTLETLAFENMAPMLYRTNFSLRPGDTIYKIKLDKLFFFKRLLENYKGILGYDELYDVLLKNYNGKHVYIKYIPPKSGEESLLSKLDAVTFDIVKEGKSFYRTSLSGDKEHLLSSRKDKIYALEDGTEIIETSNLKFYLDKFKYHSIKISNNIAKYLVNELGQKLIPKKFIEIKDIIASSKSSTAQSFKSYLDLINNNLDTLKARNLETILSNFRIRDNHDSNLYNLIDSDSFAKYLYEYSKKIRTSFFKSLNTLAARIPAQCMASFMPMKTVGFILSDVNDVYVSKWQIWLQGSDFDVDKVTLLGYEFNKHGLYEGWSNLFDYTSQLSLKISEELPFPSGEKVSVEHVSKDLEKQYDLALKNLEIINNILDIKENNLIQFKFNDDTLSESERIRYFREFVELIKDININDFKLYLPESDGLNDPQQPLKLKFVTKVIDSHNLYLSKNKDLEERASKNFISSKGYEVSINPANLILSLSPIDLITKPLKDIADNSPLGIKEKRNAPGNSAIQAEMLDTNMTGKDVIAIGASNGLKCFYALTLYYNTVLKSGNAHDIQKLMFNITIGEHKAQMLANAWIKDPQKLKNATNKEVFDVLIATMKNPKDQALVLSAIVSLATDNAKELKLAKLNAGSDMVGLYLYGISIGMDFRDISKILISNTAIILNRLQKGNIFNGKRGRSYMPSVFEYLENFKVPEDIGKIVLNPMNELLSKDLEITIEKVFKFYWGNNISKNLNLAKQHPLEVLRNLRNFKNTIILYLNLDKTNVYVPKNIVIFKFLESVEKYVRAKLDIKISDYNNLKTLYYGFAELGRLNKMLSLNGGEAVLLKDKLAFIYSIENVLNDRYTELEAEKSPKLYLFKEFKASVLDKNAEDLPSGEYTISLKKFCTDNDYKNKVIDFYDTVKHTYNILDVVDKVPHFKLYLNNVVTDIYSNEVSAKYRSLKKSLDFVFSAYNVTTKKEQSYYIDATNYFIDSLLINNWLKTLPIIHGLDYTMELGTRKGNALFKDWMETYVIPKLKEMYPSNKFILDIAPVIVDKTLSKQPIRMFVLPINMMDNTPHNLNLLNLYKTSFNNLNYNALKVGNKNYPIVDLFTYYNMINYKNKVTQNSLTPIFESLNKSSTLNVLKNYEEFIAKFDNDSDLLIGIDYTKEDLLKAVAPVASEQEAKLKDLPYFYIYDPSNMRYILMLRVESKKLKRLKSREEDPYEDSDNYGNISDENLSDLYGIDEVQSTNLNIDNYIPKILDNIEYNLDLKLSASLHIENSIDIQALNNNNLRLGTVIVNKILKIKSESSDVIKYYPETINYNKNIYSLTDLVKEAKLLYSNSETKITKKDFEIPIKNIEHNGKIKQIVDIEKFNKTIDYILNNPCK